MLTSAVAVPMMATALAAPSEAAVAEVAAKASCGKNEICLFAGENFKGRKITVKKSRNACWTLQPEGYGFRVRSLITGKNRGITAMRTKPRCKGKPSMSYPAGPAIGPRT
ncbi:peptidase inhibitor family I36 protein [Actinomadura kijaniata]|uniref:peptidase inhibitor family I36 protein n=1 Tax=Actinomadura kijaniata TaxID=46161 RepID=UPI003F1B2FB0